MGCGMSWRAAPSRARVTVSETILTCVMVLMTLGQEKAMDWEEWNKTYIGGIAFCAKQAEPLFSPEGFVKFPCQEQVIIRCERPKPTDD